MQEKKKLILNADDYGICTAVNTAIEELALRGLLGGVSVLANGAQWESATTFLRAHPQISAGIHLNLIEGKPLASNVGVLLGKNQELAGRNAVMLRWLLQPRTVSSAVEREWRAQIECLLQTGIRLTQTVPAGATASWTRAPEEAISRTSARCPSLSGRPFASASRSANAISVSSATRPSPRSVAARMRRSAASTAGLE